MPGWQLLGFCQGQVGSHAVWRGLGRLRDVGRTGSGYSRSEVPRGCPRVGLGGSRKGSELLGNVRSGEQGWI